MSAPPTPADLARIRDLVDRSSLGTPGARQLQQRTSDDPIADGLAEILDADARAEIAIGDLFKRACEAAIKRDAEEHPFDVEASWARISHAIDERERKKRLSIIFGSAVSAGLLGAVGGWLMMREWRSGRDES